MTATTGWLETQSARIERLLDDIAAGSSPDSLARVEELVRALVNLYGAGLQRLIEQVRAAGLDESALREVCADELVSGLLVLHGIHPLRVRERVEHALDRVRPSLGARAGGVELIEIGDDGTVELEFSGDDSGGAISQQTLEAIEQAIASAAPEVIRIQLRGCHTKAEPELIQIRRSAR